MSTYRPAGVAATMVAACLLLAGCVSAPAVTPRTSGADGIQQSDAVLNQLLTSSEPGCSAAVARDGHVVWAGALGLANTASHTSLTTGSRFDFASVSKQFTATAILLLAEEGALSLSDSVRHWLPALPAWAERITVADLLHHTTGISDYAPTLTGQGHTLADPTTQADALAVIAATTPAEPGRFDYSNSNYVLLAEIASTVTNMPFGEFLAGQVFGAAPLALEPASPDTVTGYSDGKPVTSAWKQIGDGGIVGTPSELAQWADYYRKGLPGHPSLPAAAVADAVDTGDPAGSRYGAGILVGSDGSLSHIGTWAGEVTLFGVAPDRQTSIVVSCNSTSAPANTLAQALRTIWQ